MTKREPCPSTMPWLSPYLVVKNVDESADFYHKVFGFEKRSVFGSEGGPSKYAELGYKDQIIMLGLENEFGNQAKSPASSGVISPMGLYLYCEDVDKFYETALTKGAKGLLDPENMFWGDRVCRLLDHDGYVWSFATNVADFDESKA